MGSFYCPACRASVSFVLPPVCPLCGRPQNSPGLCKGCSERPLHIDGIRSVAVFDGALRRAIHGLKYNYAHSLAAPLGGMLVAFWHTSPLPAEVIVPVPLHPRRRRERGYNQAALLALRLGEGVGLPVLTDALRRVRNTRSQTRLNARQRRQNVAGAFACAGEGVRGQRVLLVDDVCTTGATLEACSIALKEGGARSVWALTLARAL